MNGDLLFLLLAIAAPLCAIGIALLAVIMILRRRRPRTPLEQARRAVRAASRQSARLGRSGQRGKGSGKQFDDATFYGSDGGSAGF
ncbi:hypothetical protein [Catellatospora sp. NPDC049133]|jgi:hypothetical protein|uniref:hypothetical protein n=1 Tax=Catellatospora sp. NPDC049133 TaxID=3155499 RepID=UPI0033FF97A9